VMRPHSKQWHRTQQRLAGDRMRSQPRVTPEELALLPPRDQPALTIWDNDEWPPVQSQRPTWWQVHRIEMHGEKRVAVLIAQFKDETRAFRAAGCQKWQARVSKWNSRQRPYDNGKPPKVCELMETS
jgi:hypothetical protein